MHLPLLFATSGLVNSRTLRLITLCACLAAHDAWAAEPLKVSGDLRLRAQGDYSVPNSADRESAQLRARLGAAYAFSDRVILGARLTTGSAEDPNSTDVQLSDFDDDLEVSLDLAYAQLKINGLEFYAGKIPQPFRRTDLVWDADVNPQGLSALYAHELSANAQLQVRSLYFIVDDQRTGGDSTMMGGQLSYEAEMLPDWSFDVSWAYYDYRLGSSAGADEGDFRSNLRNPDGSYLSDFDLCDLIIGLRWSGAGARWPVKITAEYVENLGARTEADSGYAIELAAGRASADRDWRMGYGYSAAQTDAVFAAYSHDNIALATNYRLHTLTLDYVPALRTLVSANWYRYEPQIATMSGKEWTNRVRLAVLFFF